MQSPLQEPFWTAATFIFGSRPVLWRGDVANTDAEGFRQAAAESVILSFN